MTQAPFDSNAQYRGVVSGNYFFGATSLIAALLFAIFNGSKSTLSLRLLAVTLGIVGTVSLVSGIRSKLVFLNDALLIEGVWHKRIRYADIKSISSDTVLYGAAHGRSPVARYIIVSNTGKQIKIIRTTYRDYKGWAERLLILSKAFSITVDPQTLERLQSATRDVQTP